MKASNCMECKRFDFDKMPFANLCKKGHKPRFYLDPLPGLGRNKDGWKMVCNDFKKEGEK